MCQGLAVKSINFEGGNIEQSVADYIDILPINSVAQIHLAGCSPASEGELVIDDHACPVSEQVWQGYQQALQRFGAIPTLIEWDNNLPAWTELISEADKARRIADIVFDNC
jgi:uncharacterized protein (UPF0276 family)